MKKLLSILIFGFLFSCSSKFEPVKVNLESQWDTVRPLANPDKGWYHHLIDNGTWRYEVRNDSIFDAFPGMDHIYLRLAWSYLDPEEKKFDWSLIDNAIDKYVPKGYGVSFRVTCKERRGVEEGGVNQKIDGVIYATPKWVRDAGAKGVEVVSKGGALTWSPDWDDPVFLEKLDNFHRVFSERYCNEPWVRYVDIGSIGDYGEGHTNPSTKIPPTVEEIKANIDVYLKNYKNTQLVVADGWFFWNKPENEAQELYDYAVERGISVRDDSPMVEWWLNKNFDTWSISHPHFYDPLYKEKPIVFELQHYGNVKADGNWLGKNGSEIIPEYNVSGAEIFRNALKIMHTTYIGYHGYVEEFLTDNPDLAEELLNLCGYWYFPKSVHIAEFDDDNLSFEIEWLNKGVAPAYNVYALKGKLIPDDKSAKIIEFEIEDSGNKNWMPGETYMERYSVVLNEKPKGNYQLAIQVFDQKSNRIVDLGLAQAVKKDDFFLLQKIQF
ncbi:MAG: hypothetical protein ACOCVA_06470 [Prolixibacteraceae bacterium]